MARTADQTRTWWIATAAFSRGGRKITGPFKSREDAETTLPFAQMIHKPTALVVDYEDRHERA